MSLNFAALSPELKMMHRKCIIIIGQVEVYLAIEQNTFLKFVTPQSCEDLEKVCYSKAHLSSSSASQKLKLHSKDTPLSRLVWLRLSEPPIHCHTDALCIFCSRTRTVIFIFTLIQRKCVGKALVWRSLQTEGAAQTTQKTLHLGSWVLLYMTWCRFEPTLTITPVSDG